MASIGRAFRLMAIGVLAASAWGADDGDDEGAGKHDPAWVENVLRPWLAANPKWQWNEWSEDLLGETVLTDADMAALGELKGLRNVWINGGKPRFGARSPLIRGEPADFKVTADGLRTLANLPELRSVKLMDAPAADDRVLEALATLPRLRSVDLSRTPLVTDAGLIHLGKAKELRSIYLNACPAVTDAGLAALGDLSLRRLVLGRCPAVTDRGFVTLAGQDRLTTLALADCPGITDRSLAVIGGFEALEELSFESMPQFTAEGMRPLSALRALTSLGLMKTGADGPRLARFRDAPELERAYLIGNPELTDEGLAELGRPPKLSYLDISDNAKLTDACLKTLAEFPALSEVAYYRMKHAMVDQLVTRQVTEETPDGPATRLVEQIVTRMVEEKVVPPGFRDEGVEAFMKARPDVKLSASHHSL